MGLINWFLHTRWNKKYDKVLKEAREHNLVYLRRKYDFYRAILLALTIAFFLNLIDFLRDAVLGNPSWKIGLFFIFVIAIVISIFLGKSIDGESALEVREKGKQNSRKEAFKIIEQYQSIE